MIMDWLLRMVPWYVRWGLLLLLVAVAALAGAALMHSRDDKRYEALVAEHAAYRGRVQQAGEDAQLRTNGIKAAFDESRLRLEKTHAQVTAARDRALSVMSEQLRAAQEQLRIGRRNELPGVPDATDPADDTVCFDREQLDLGIRAALQRFSQGFADRIRRGAEGIDLSVLCTDWVVEQKRINP